MVLSSAKFGLSEPDRCILGYHAYRRSSAAIYSRDLHAAPLRRLERMIACVRNGSFIPDASRSGMIDRDAAASSSLKRTEFNKGVAFGVLEGEQYRGDLNDSPLNSDLEDIIDGAIPQEERDRMESALTEKDDPWLKPESRRYEPFHESLRIEIAENPLQTDFDRDTDEEAAFDRRVEKVPATDDFKDDFGDADTSDSESSGSASSVESDTDEVLSKSVAPAFQGQSDLVWRQGYQVYQHCKSKILHLDPNDGQNTFVCGRKSGAGYRVFTQGIFMQEWKCKQCSQGRPVRNFQGAIDALDRALKRARKSE